MQKTITILNSYNIDEWMSLRIILLKYVIYWTTHDHPMCWDLPRLTVWYLYMSYIIDKFVSYSSNVYFKIKTLPIQIRLSVYFIILYWVYYIF